ncbi:hypothetical protein CT0861_01603, partial [Colletotrichum tofieldiae]
LEDPLAAVQVPEAAPAPAPPGRRRRGRDGGRGACQEGRDGRRTGAVEGRDADRGGDAAAGQVHHVRPQGEEVPQGHSQASQVDESFAEIEPARLLNDIVSRVWMGCWLETVWGNQIRVGICTLRSSNLCGKGM